VSSPPQPLAVSFAYKEQGFPRRIGRNSIAEVARHVAVASIMRKLLLVSIFLSGLAVRNRPRSGSHEILLQCSRSSGMPG
jgi:hypothetical protein